MKLLKLARLKLAGSFLAVSFIAFAPPGNSQAVPQKAPDMGTIWAADWSGKKLDHMMTLYTRDAVFYTSDSRVAGAASLRDLFQKALEANNPTIHMHRVIAEQSGNLAHESGDYEETLVTAGQKRELQGHYLMVLRKEDGRWLIAQQMWTETPKSPEKSAVKP